MSETDKLTVRLHDAMLGIYDRAKDETGYNATRFLEMVRTKGGLATAQYLLSGDVLSVSEGFTKLALAGRLDLTVEALIQEPEWRTLFSTEEIKTAERRLRK